MKINFHLKLAIGIIVVFGLLLAGFALYEPVWFKYHTWQLESDNPDVREAAIEKLAATGERAIPYVRKWLRYGSDDLVCGACLVLEKMEGSAWETVLLELEAILRQSPSVRTTAAATVLYKKGYSFEKADAPVKFNMYLYLISIEKDNSPKRNNAIIDLAKLKDKRAALTLIRILASGKREDISCRVNAAVALGMLGDIRAVYSLIRALKYKLMWENDQIREMAACSLGKIGDPHAIEPLIEILKIRHTKGVFYKKEVRFYAERSLKKLTGQDFGNRYEKWKQWYEANKETLVPEEGKSK